MIKILCHKFQVKRQPRFFEESEDDFEGYRKKERPKSAVYLDPGEMLPKSRLKSKTKSSKSVSSRDTSGKQLVENNPHRMLKYYLLSIGR